MLGRLQGRVNVPALFTAIVLLLLAMAACVPDGFNTIFVSVRDPGVTEDGVEYSTEDILLTIDTAEPSNWYKVFDGSEFGLTTRHDISAFSFNEFLWNPIIPLNVTTELFEDIPELYLTFTPNGVIVPGVPTKVAGHDIVRFTETGLPGQDAGTFQLFFDGSDVGLTLNSEKVDGIGYWPPESFPLAIQEVDLPVDCSAGVIFITTMGRYRVPSANGGSIVGNGSDVLLFCAFNTGPKTAGLWYRVYNGEEEGIHPLQAGFSADVIGFELIDPAADPAANVTFAFTPRKPFTHPGLLEPGQLSDVYVAATGGFITGGPEFNFNEDDSIPALNGVADSIGLWDFAIEPAP